MKTFLEHCKGVAAEAGLAGGEDAIISTIAQSGQAQRIVRYVRQAWVEIQNRHQSTGLNWRWKRVGFTLTTVAEQDSYSYTSAAITDDVTAASIATFRNWMIKDYDDPPKIYLQSAGEATATWLTYINWNDFKYLYRMGVQNSTYPCHITVNPQNQLVLGPKPNDAYVVKADYLRGVQIFSEDEDVPDWPGECEAFEDAIMYRALSKYGLHANAIECITAGEDGFATYIGDLEGDQLSEIHIGEPLA